MRGAGKSLVSAARERTLSHEEARAFYDRLGARQDSQAFYEDAATGILLRHASFESARSVLEFGCGTGRFAATLVERYLPPDARYLGLDASTTMVGLAEKRLAPFGERAAVRLSDGSPKLAIADASVDRFVSNFVLDLLSDPDIETLLEEAHRVLVPGGLLALVSLTRPFTPGSRVVMAGWRLLFNLRPALVGGCRPIGLLERLPPPQWNVRHHERISRFGIPAEVLVTERFGSGA